jgi:hypothetical protein
MLSRSPASSLSRAAALFIIDDGPTDDFDATLECGSSIEPRSFDFDDSFASFFFFRLDIESLLALATDGFLDGAGFFSKRDDSQEEPEDFSGGGGSELFSLRGSELFLLATGARVLHVDSVFFAFSKRSSDGGGGA